MTIEILKLTFSNPAVYLISAALIFTISSGKSYLNIGGVIKGYCDNFIKSNARIVWVLFIVPLLLAIGVNIYKVIDDKVLNNLTVIISILMSLFFTFLTFFKNYENKDNNENYNAIIDKQKYIAETQSITSYEIVLSISILILCFVYPIIETFCLKWIFSLILYFLSFHMLINLFILLKRYTNKQNKQ